MEGLGKQMIRCVIVGAAPFTDAAYLKTYIQPQDYVIAADGGQRLLAAMGISADLIIGDFDSSSKPSTGDCRVLPTRKDDTDVMAAVRSALTDGATSFTLLGCMGGRFDHTMANVFVLYYLQAHGADGVMVDEHHEVSLLTAGCHTVPVRKGWYVSLLPYGGAASGVTIRYAEYPLEDAHLDIAHPLGVSNGFTEKPMEITLKSGALLLILAKEP